MRLKVKYRTYPRDSFIFLVLARFQGKEVTQTLRRVLMRAESVMPVPPLWGTRAVHLLRIRLHHGLKEEVSAKPVPPMWGTVALPMVVEPRRLEPLALGRSVRECTHERMLVHTPRQVEALEA